MKIESVIVAVEKGTTFWQNVMGVTHSSRTPENQPKCMKPMQ
jgi:hypothetical protein